jgi:hypothetical protein
MLANALTVLSFHGGTAVPQTVSLVDTDNGRTVRALNLGGGNKSELIVGVSESTENKGVLSDRYLIRWDDTKTESTSPFAPAKASAYLVIVAPRRPDFTYAEVAAPVEKLISLLNGGVEINLGNETGILGRIYSGEK